MVAGLIILKVLGRCCRQRLETRRQEAVEAEATVQELTKKERSLEAELEEATKQVRALKDEADNVKDTETAEAQHVQVREASCLVWPGLF